MLDHGSCQNCPFFHFIILGLVGTENVFYSPGKCVYDILERKKLFLGFKIKSSKSPKIEVLPQGLVHGFGQKLAIFPFYYFNYL